MPVDIGIIIEKVAPATLKVAADLMAEELGKGVHIDEETKTIRFTMPEPERYIFQRRAFAKTGPQKHCLTYLAKRVVNASGG